MGVVVLQYSTVYQYGITAYRKEKIHDLFKLRQTR